jgi:cellulose biosynthesis protein BcsQ
MVDCRKKLHRELVEALRTEFSGVLRTVIPYASDIERMGLERDPVVNFAPNSKAAVSYRQLWSEVVLHLSTGNNSVGDKVANRQSLNRQAVFL